MGVIMQNRVTTEFKEVEPDSSEFFDLRAQVHTDGRPKWAQTGHHKVAAFATRLENGNLKEEDLGDAVQPLRVDTVGDPRAHELNGDVGYPAGHPPLLVDEDGSVAQTREDREEEGIADNPLADVEFIQ